MNPPTQDSFNFEIRTEASLDDFGTRGFAPIIEALHKLANGSLRELFITGSYGAGKTHLANALYQYYTKTTHKTAVSLLLGELIEQDPHAETLAGLEMFDMIIIDDVQLVRHSYEWQEGMFHLINRVRERGKQMLFFADHNPRELQIGLLDLTTRLTLAPLLPMPTYSNDSDRSILIHTILRRKNWQLPDEILAYLLENGPRNAGDIIAVLNHIIPHLTHLTRVQLPKKTINEINNIIDRETFLLEVTDHDHDGFGNN